MSGGRGLTPAQFAAIAAGYGDAGAIAALGDGQLAKRKALLALVHRDALGTPHAAAIDEALALLLRAEAADPVAVDGVLAHPHLDAWAMACLNGLADLAEGRPPADLAATVGHLAAVATAAAIATGIAFDIAVPTRFGAVCVPGLGEATGLGDGPARATGGPGEGEGDGPARATGGPGEGEGDGRARATGGAGEGEGDGPARATGGPGETGGAGGPRFAVRFEGADGAVVRLGGPGWRPRRTVALAGGHSLAIEDQDPYRHCYGYRPRPHLGEAEARHFAKLLQEAWLLIERDHPGHAVGIRHALRSVVPVHTDTAMMVSSASRHAYGSIAMSVPDTAADVALLVIHEHMHAKLGGLLDLVPLHATGGPATLHAPWRLDPRPAGALLQGVYAHAGVTDYWRRRRHAGDGDAARAEAQYVYWAEMNRRAATTLINSSELTPSGEQFVTILGSTLETWAAEEVDDAIAFHARLFVLAQTVRWRLLNWRPRAGEAELLLDGPRPDRLRPHGEAAPGAPARPADAGGLLAALRPWLDGRVAPAGPARPDDPGALLLGHDPQGAARACVARLDRDGADDDAWVGLAVARAWISHREQRPDPLAELLERRPDALQAAVLKLQPANSRHAAEELLTALGSLRGAS